MKLNVVIIMEEPWLPWAGLMGFSFIFLFNIIAFTAQKLGVAIASVANKLSMVIPFLFSIYLYNEKATPLKIAGIVIALLAVVLTTWPKSGRADGNRSVRQSWMYIIPLVLFLGSGLLDTMVLNMIVCAAESNMFNVSGSLRFRSITSRMGCLPPANLFVKAGLSSNAVSVPTRIADSSDRH